MSARCTARRTWTRRSRRRRTVSQAEWYPHADREWRHLVRTLTRYGPAGWARCCAPDAGCERCRRHGRASGAGDRMAARLAGYATTTAVLGGNRVQKIREWRCYSEPSETYFEVRARVQTTREQVQAIADRFSATIEQLLAAPDITDIAWGQDVTSG